MFTLGIEAGSGPDATVRLIRTLDSLHRQNFRNIEILVLGPKSDACRDWLRLRDFSTLRGLFPEPTLTAMDLFNQPAADRSWRGDYLMVVPVGATFDEDAFTIVNREINRKAPVLPELVVCDYEQCHPDGLSGEPVLSPGWDPDFFLAQDYIGPAFFVSRELLSRRRCLAEPVDSQCDWLRSLAAPGVIFPVCHIRKALLHLPSSVPADDPLPATTATPSLPEPPPRVAVIIPSKDQPDLLERCLAFLDFETRIPLEIVIVDNGSKDTRTLALYADLDQRRQAKIVPMNSAFNFSRMINLGVTASRAEVLLLLNNDIEISQPGTLERLLAQALRPEIGVVGSKLLYPDGTVQHAGVLLGTGGEDCSVRHVMRLAPGESAGPLDILKTIRNYQAVTGALMMIRRTVFEQIGPFNEHDLPVEYNDIDFCLRVRQAGYRVICLPLDGIFHCESATRSRGHLPANLKMRRKAMAYMKSHWFHQFEADPYDNPGLNLGNGTLPFIRAVPSPAAPENPPGCDAPSSSRLRRRWIALCIRRCLDHLPEPMQNRLRSAVRDHGASSRLADRLKYGPADSYELPPDFDWETYVQCHVDLRHLATRQDAVNHYLCHGRYEGRLYAKDVSVFISGESFPDNMPRESQDGLCLVGHLRSEIGLGQAARNLACALDGQRYPLSFQSLFLPGRDNEPEYQTKITGKRNSRFNLTVLGLPSIETLETDLPAGTYSIFYPFWELGKIPEPWLERLGRYDEVWLPSRFGVQAFPAGFPVPVRFMPLAVRRPEWLEETEAGPRGDNGILHCFTFFDFDSYTARKNPQAAVAAFREAFPLREKAVRLTIKVRGMNDQGWRQWLSRIEADDPRIRVIDKTLSRREMDQLTRESDVFISLHRSEGFGFGVADALAAGKAVVSTDYSSTCDFVTPETGYPVEYDLLPVGENEYPGAAGQVWAEPRLGSAVSALRSIYADPDLARARGAAGMTLMRTEYAPEIIGRRMVARLREIEKERK